LLAHDLRGLGHFSALVFAAAIINHHSIHLGQDTANKQELRNRISCHKRQIEKLREDHKTVAIKSNDRMTNPPL